MKYSIPTNWQDDLIRGLPGSDGSELYGKLPEDVVGGGRASAILPRVSLGQAERHVREAHAHGLQFNYLLNATCIPDGASLERPGSSFLQLMDWLIDVHVDSVTVSAPSLFKVIRQYAPKLKIYVSVQENINHIDQIRRWDALGADKINLSVVDANRDFRLLKALPGKVKCEIQLIANLRCLMGCHAFHGHANLQAHASQSQHGLRGFLIDYYTLQCHRARLSDPVEYIKSPWIRPEDVPYYAKAGVGWLKFVGREMDSAKIHFIYNAYRQGRHEGNLLELFSGNKKNLFDLKKLPVTFRYFFKPQHVNVFELLAARAVFQDEGISIDNRKLDGFLEYFWQGKCSTHCGVRCRYCHEVAARAMQVDDDKRKKVLAGTERFINKLVDGRMFNY